MLQIRQGDVGLIEREIPREARKVAIRPLALGEVTGHSHRVIEQDAPAVEMYEIDGDSGTRTFMRVSESGSVSIVHEEHGTVTLPAGWTGEVVIAREYDEEGDFRVAD